VVAACEAQGDCKTFSGTIITFTFISNFVQTPKLGDIAPLRALLSLLDFAKYFIYLF
jgi:hypothetical protein